MRIFIPRSVYSNLYIYPLYNTLITGYLKWNSFSSEPLRIVPTAEPNWTQPWSRFIGQFRTWKKKLNLTNSVSWFISPEKETLVLRHGSKTSTCSLPQEMISSVLWQGPEQLNSSPSRRKRSLKTDLFFSGNIWRSTQSFPVSSRDQFQYFYYHWSQILTFNNLINNKSWIPKSSELSQMRSAFAAILVCINRKRIIWNSNESRVKIDNF